jgi:hypothetical protein
VRASRGARADQQVAVGGAPARDRLAELARAVGAVEAAVHDHDAALDARVAVERQVPDLLGGDRIVRGEAVHHDDAPAEEVELVLAQGADVGRRRGHSAQRHLPGHAELVGHGEGDATFCLCSVGARQLLVGDGLESAGEGDEARATVAQAASNSRDSPVCSEGSRAPGAPSSASATSRSLGPITSGDRRGRW